ncbi:MAG TPA: hypothetical protein VGU02_08115 [Gaiellaceae bacterium]|nr:hypothetical protein [Gaiellaceae bacterium]
MTDRVDRLRRAFAELNAGDLRGFNELMTADARWLAVPGSGWEGDTPT